MLSDWEDFASFFSTVTVSCDPMWMHRMGNGENAHVQTELGFFVLNLHTAVMTSYSTGISGTTLYVHL
jgi:hypothetical protein